MIAVPSGTEGPRIRALGLVDYESTWQAMRDFTAARQPATADEIWLLQHPPVFTQGLAGRDQHLHAPGEIPVVRIDRGGQVTYHGPGQLLAYLLIDLRRRHYGIRQMVSAIEGAVIATLAELGVAGERRPGMPGVYVRGDKISAIGLRVSRGCTYHGLALNVDLDLGPFARIDACGYPGLASTSLAIQGVATKIPEIEPMLARHLVQALYGNE